MKALSITAILDSSATIENLAELGTSPELLGPGFIFTALAGPLLSPVLIALARTAWWTAGVTLRFCAAEAIALVRGMAFWWLVLALAALLGLGFAPAGADPARVASALAESPFAAPGTMAADETIGALMRTILGARKSLPGWAFQAARKAFDVWKSIKDHKEAEERWRTVLAILRTVDALRGDIEGGLALADGRYRLVREALDAHETSLAALAARVDDLERWAHERMEAQARHLAEVERLTEANLRLALENAEKTREIERLTGQTAGETARLRAIVARPSCGFRRYWDKARATCVSK